MATLTDPAIASRRDRDLDLELRESEHLFREFAEHVREVFFLTTLDGAQLLYVSPGYERVWGRSCASVYADPQSWMQAIHPEDLERIAHAQQDESEGFEYTFRIIRPDGAERCILAKGIPIRNDRGEVYRIAGIAEDITRRVDLEKALRDSEAGLRRAQSLARLAHVITRPDGSFESWSDSLPELLGLAPEKMPGTMRAWIGLVARSDRRHFRDAVVRAGRGGRRAEVEYRLCRGDGALIHIRQGMEPLEKTAGPGYQGRWFCTLQDITLKRLAQEASRESGRRVSETFERVHLLGVILDREGRIIDCNDYLLQLTGWQREEVLGGDWIELFIPPDSPDMTGLFTDLLRDMPSAWHHENEILTRGGARRLVRWNNSVLRSADGGVEGVAGLGEDITERKRAEDEVRRLNTHLEWRVAERTAQLEAANKELEAFDRSVSHDLRAPANRIQGFAEALSQECGPDLNAQARAFLDRIVAASRDMNQLIDDLLALSMVAREDFQREEVDLAGEARGVLDRLRKAHPGRVVETVVMTQMAAIADPGLARVVLENLIGNAWKFTLHRERARIEVGMTAGEGTPTYWVRDNGAGFDEAHAANLFAPFRRLHATGEFAGTGIGLSTVQRIVHRHGGRIWAEGAPGSGATFYFTLASDSTTPARP